MQTLKELMLEAPDGQLDASMKPLIEKWPDEDPSALQVLEVLDYCAGFALASTFTMMILQSILDDAMIRENTTREVIYAQADELWRKTMYND